MLGMKTIFSLRVYIIYFFSGITPYGLWRFNEKIIFISNKFMNSWVRQ